MPVVVLLKSESEGPDKFVEALEEKNFDVRSITCLDFQFISLDELKIKLDDADQYEGIIFTSPRAVHAVHKAIGEKSEDLTSWKQKNNFAVGDSTSELAKSLLNVDTTGQQSGNAKNLASFVIESVKEKSTKPFLFPSGNLRQETLEKSLNESGIEVESLEVYETIPHASLDESIENLKTEKVDFLVYFSPSGVKFSLPILKKHQIDLSKLKIIAIGPSTKKSLDENDLQCYRTCSKPSPESLIETLSN